MNCFYIVVVFKTVKYRHLVNKTYFQISKSKFRWYNVVWLLEKWYYRYWKRQRDKKMVDNEIYCQYLNFDLKHSNVVSYYFLFLCLIIFMFSFLFWQMLNIRCLRKHFSTWAYLTPSSIFTHILILLSHPQLQVSVHARRLVLALSNLCPNSSNFCVSSLLYERAYWLCKE